VKTSRNLNKMTPIFWVGIRESEISDSQHLFAGSVTYYGSNQNGNRSYCNERVCIYSISSEAKLFVKNSLLEIIAIHPDCSFLWYNLEKAYCYGEEILKKSLGLNSQDLFQTFNNKIQTRFWAEQFCSVPTSKKILGQACEYKYLQCQMSNAKAFIIQEALGSGGKTSYLMTSKNQDVVYNLLTPQNEYLVSAYIEHSISVNVHALIADKHIAVSNGSLQIIENENNTFLYKGGDYIAFSQLDFPTQKKINQTAQILCKHLQSQGYRGIVGLDFVVDANNNEYFIEFNCRFQSSTMLLNTALIKNNKRSVFEQHIQCFADGYKPDLTVCVSQSFYKYYCNFDVSILHPKLKLLEQHSSTKIFYNGLSLDSTKQGQYMFDVTYNRSICDISPNHTLWVSENIKFEKDVVRFNKLDDKLWHKANLLTRGVRIDLEEIEKAIGKIKEGTFSSIDMTLENGLYVNCPVNIEFTQLSPYRVRVIAGVCTLCFFDTPLCTVEIESLNPHIESKVTKSGHPIKRIAYLSGDRIRITCAPSCCFKDSMQGCKFCNSTRKPKDYSLSDILDTLEICKQHIPCRHYLIGGGSDESAYGWETICLIANKLKSITTEISCMCIPPSDPKTLEKMKANGITDVSINIEIFDENQAIAHMPGKGRIAREHYFDTLKKAVSIWGTGNVRSIVILGLEPMGTLLSGIERLCQLGVQPVLSVFRPTAGCDYENNISPPIDYLLDVYQQIEQICIKNKVELGPRCPRCQNNIMIVE